MAEPLLPFQGCGFQLCPSDAVDRALRDQHIGAANTIMFRHDHQIEPGWGDFRILDLDRKAVPAGGLPWQSRSATRGPAAAGTTKRSKRE